MIENETAGDPMNEQKWIRKSLRPLSRELTNIGHPISHPTVGRLLKKQNYSLKSNSKNKETNSQNPDRNKQFKYIKKQKERYKKEKSPIISIDTKKKELIGEFKNNGKTWCVKAEEVNVHDFGSEADGKAVPYGIYDIGKNKGYVCLGTSSDTAEFAVDVIERWWKNKGIIEYPKAKKILILADSGGSNSCRSRLWKKQIQERLSEQFGLNVMVCHYPTGCSKWNTIEHRLFSYISMNWAGKPLTSYENMLAYIQGTNTVSGLTVEADLLDKIYTKGQKVSNKEMKDLNIKFHKICPRWNYVISPRVSGNKHEKFY